jgi:hypothetical protein
MHLSFDLTGDPVGLSVPPPRSPERADELWRHTCFEVFVAAEQGYYEFNLSPSSEWAAYRFDGYRKGMREAHLPDPIIIWAESREGAELIATLRLPGDSTGPFGLSAVIEARDGSRSYWALAHPPGKPDFHHPACFIGQLPPAR